MTNLELKWKERELSGVWIKTTASLKKKKPLVGKKVKVTRGAYRGRTGVIEYCSSCCRCYRIQFDDIGNSCRLKRLRKSVVFI